MHDEILVLRKVDIYRCPIPVAIRYTEHHLGLRFTMFPQRYPFIYWLIWNQIIYVFVSICTYIFIYIYTEIYTHYTIHMIQSPTSIFYLCYVKQVRYPYPNFPQSIIYSLIKHRHRWSYLQTCSHPEVDRNKRWNCQNIVPL